MRAYVVVALAIALLASALAWHLPARPVAVAAWPEGRVTSLSYAPYLRGDDPLSGTHANAEEIERDLRLLLPLARGVRTYSSGGGFNMVPAIAEKLGLDVMHGAWVNGSDIDTSKQIEDLITQAKAHPNSVKRVIVGNEALLRRDLPPEKLIMWIRNVKASVTQPVTYADVWEFWLKHREIAQEVDFITVHFLPYWENDPVSAAEAIEHIRNVYRQMQGTFPGKQIVIGEVGWPSAGRSREGARAGNVEQARFISAFLRLAKEEGFNYNLIEAFDQPWKKAQEGRTGGNWGLYTADRTTKYVPGDPVSPAPHWWLGLGLTLALFGGLAAARRAEFGSMNDRALAASLVMTLFLAHLCSMQLARFMADDWYNGSYWFAAPRLALQVSLALALWSDTWERLAGRDGQPFHAHFAGYLGSLNRASTFEHFFRVSVLLALGMTILILFDGRYRDFPHDDFLILAYGYLGCQLALLVNGKARKPMPGIDLGQTKGGKDDTWFERRGLALAAGCALLLLLKEGPDNFDMLLWLLQLAAIALPHWLVWRNSRTQVQQLH